MPTFAEWQELRQNPQPAYAEYERLRAETRAVFGPFVGPQEIAEAERVFRERDLQWCRAVLGWDVTRDQLRRLLTGEARLLVLADRRNLDPPVPEIIRHWQAEAEQQQADQQRRRNERADADRKRWETALATCQVQVEVRPNTRGRRTGALTTEPLRHAVPLAYAMSGTGSRPRRHRVGVPLCETASRHRPRTLGAPEQSPATCKNCLTHAATLRPITEEQP